jgi:Flp pilus assembly pilin Flp
MIDALTALVLGVIAIAAVTYVAAMVGWLKGLKRR